MGFTSPWHWLVVLLVVVLIFGTKKLRNLGGDLGEAVRGFRKGLSEDEPTPSLKSDENTGGTTASRDNHEQRRD